jgi:putative nucleotidyltransferase with HDIG domain
LLPAVVVRIASLDPLADGFPDQIESLAQCDPPFATRLLQAANNSYSGAVSPILTLPAAISRVGARTLAEMVTCHSVARVFVVTKRGQLNLWAHSIQVAVGARKIAQLNPELGVEPEQAYLAGLLHDIGRFVMFEHSPEELGQVDETWSNVSEMVEAELAICGYDHAELGWLACGKWAFPEKVSTLIRDHHVYESARTTQWPPEMVQLVHLVQQADMLSVAMIVNPNLTRLAIEDRALAVKQSCCHPQWAKPPVPAPRLAEAIDEIAATSNQMIRSLDLVLPERMNRMS